MTAFPMTALSFASLAFASGLNSLANGSSVLSSGVIDNSDAAARFDWIVAEISLTSINTTANGQVQGFLVPSIDGTYLTAAGGSNIPLASNIYPYDACSLDPGASAKQAGLLFLNCLPVPYKLLIVNATGVAFASTGNTVKWAGCLRETR